MEKQRYINSLSKCSLCDGVAADRPATEQTDERYDVLSCSHGGLHCAVTALHRTQSSDWWEYVVLDTFDDERWCADFVTCGVIFGGIRGRLVHHDTSVR